MNAWEGTTRDGIREGEPLETESIVVDRFQHLVLEPLTNYAKVFEKLLRFSDDDGDEQAVELWGEWQAAKAALRKAIGIVSDTANERFVDYLDGHPDRSIEYGDVRLYAANARREKVKDPAKTLLEVLEWTGDPGEAFKCLASNAIKVGAVEGLISEYAPDRDEDGTPIDKDKWAKDFRAEHFERTDVVNPKTGKPKRTAKTSSPIKRKR